MALVLFVDTSAMRGAFPQSLPAKALRDATHRGDVELHVSTIVERELATGLAADTQLKLDKLASWAPDEERSVIEESFSRAAEHLRRLPNLLEQSVREWLDSVGAVRHAIAADHATLVFDHYFRGVPPFRSKKNRNDLPDAFIYFSLRDLARNANVPVCFLTNDKHLRDACEKIPGVTVHASFLDVFKQFNIKHQPNDYEASRYCKERQDDLLGRAAHLLRDSIAGHPVNLVMRGEGTVVSPGEVKSIDFDMSDRYHTPPDLIVIPFHAGLRGVEVRSADGGDGFVVPIHAEGSCIVEVLSDWSSHLSIGKVEVEISSLDEED